MQCSPHAAFTCGLRSAEPQTALLENRTIAIVCSPRIARNVLAPRLSAVVVLDGQHGVGDAVQQAAVCVTAFPPGDEQAVEHDLDQMAATEHVIISPW